MWYRKTPRTLEDAQLNGHMAGCWLESRNAWREARPVLVIAGLAVAALGAAAFVFWGSTLN